MKLTQKIVLIFAFLFVPAFLFFGIYSTIVLERQILSNAQISIDIFVNNEGKEIDVLFQKLESIGKRSRTFLISLMTSAHSAVSRKEFDRKYHIINGALRSDISQFNSKDVSGVFLSSRSALNDTIRNIITATESDFDDYAKGVLSSVFNMYLITRHQFIRIYEKNWALEIEPDHDFTKDLFYYSGDPEHDPSGEPVWTDPYYDSIWKRWMTSLITPIYIDSVFLGIVGHDIILDDIYNDVLNKKYFKKGYGFIFNSNRNIVIHPHHLDKLLETANMGEKLSFSLLDEQGLIWAMTNAIDKAKTGQRSMSISFFEDKQQYYLHTYKLDFLDWYFASVIPAEEITKMLPDMEKRFLFGTVIMGVVLFSGLLILVWYSVISPVKKTSAAAEVIGTGDFDHRINYKSSDEIGGLVDSINSMAQNLKEITASRDQLNTEINERKKIEEELKLHRNKLEDLVNERTKDLENTNIELRQEIKNREKIQKALIESEEKYRSLVENINIGIYRRTPDGRIVTANTFLANLLGYKTSDEIINLNVSDLYKNKDKKTVFESKIKKHEFVRNWEENLVRKDGSVFVANITTKSIRDKDGNIIFYEGIIDDITEKKNLENQLLQVQKLESIGRLAGGVAHDFNNILVGIMGYAELLKQKFPDKKTFIGEAAEIIFRGTVRASELTRQLLGFARKGKYNPLPLDINAILKRTIDVSEKIFEKKIDIKMDLDKKLKRIEGDKFQIEQVFTNLFINAKDAMPYGGTLTIRTENITIDDTFTKDHPEFKKGEYVNIIVSDSGSGIPEGMTEQIFEPFFTTKEEGKGTGLGLSMVYGIVKNHNGFIHVKSFPGQGTSFVLHFPVTQKKYKTKKEEFKVINGHSTLMVVDDVEDVRKLAKRMLNKMGYTVILAENGREAVDIYKSGKDSIDLVILDMIMPKMPGKETFLELKKINPDVKVILSSGYSQDQKAEELLREGVLDFIQKPFRMGMLSEKLRKILE